MLDSKTKLDVRQCLQCGRDFSKKENHARCKRCRPSNLAYEATDRRKFRKAIRDYARRGHYQPRPPNFSNLEERLERWLSAKKQADVYKQLLQRLQPLKMALSSR